MGILLTEGASTATGSGSYVLVIVAYVAIFFAFIYFLKDSVVDLMKFNDTPAEIIPEDTAKD